MEKYDPLQAPESEKWLSLDESERIALVKIFHKDAGEEVPGGAEVMHALIHVVVENQFASGVEPVPAVVAKLIRQGLDRHDALHAVGAVLSEGMFNLQNGEGEFWDQPRYHKRLEKLTAKRWRKGQW
ncbi:MAG: hypothetical protein U9R57_05735 [Thermodesulfobacteriota bacterium]|nr:hypothetical protein [Thermodesulfobacteriota bacterium]